MKCKFFLLTLVFLCAQQLTAQIYEIYSMEELKPYLIPTQGLLVVFDIDSTLLKLYNNEISVPWFCNELDMLQKLTGEPREKLYRELLTKQSKELAQDYERKLHMTPVELAEPISGTIIQTLNKKNIPFLVETRRDFLHNSITHVQLNNVGVPKKTIAQWDNRGYQLTQGLNIPAYYENGILFSGLKVSKGDALKAFLQAVHYHPKRIVAVDDQRDNLVSFQEMADEMGADFIGLRYGFLDEFTGKSAPNVFDPLHCEALA